MEFPQIDPVAISIFGLTIRWYALAYLCGFLGGWRYAVYLTKLYPNARPSGDDIDNLLPWIVLGVILGGRLGYVLFYGFDYYVQNPTEIPFVWQGGMSFHGGFLGVVVSIIAFAKYHKFPLLQMGDIIATVVPIGLFFGRVANFINAELYGRITTSPLGMVFPNGGPLPRHPSQLYEAALEGLLLLGILAYLVHKPHIREKHGFIAGCFILGYAVSRFIVEFFREADAHIGYAYDMMTRGQILSIPMMLLGLAFIYISLEQNKNKNNKKQEGELT